MVLHPRLERGKRGEVEFLAEDQEEPDSEPAEEARELYRDLVRQATDREIEDSELLELDAYAMAATVEFELK